jgi:hypothetical protein
MGTEDVRKIVPDEFKRKVGGDSSFSRWFVERAILRRREILNREIREREREREELESASARCLTRDEMKRLDSIFLTLNWDGNDARRMLEEAGHKSSSRQEGEEDEERGARRKERPTLPSVSHWKREKEEGGEKKSGESKNGRKKKKSTLKSSLTSFLDGIF